MERELTYAKENLIVETVKKNGVVKRYEIRAESGYYFHREKENCDERGLVIYPAKIGLENILNDITVIKN